MSYAPQSYLTAREYLLSAFGLHGADVGIVGDEAHRRVGTSYHLGRDGLKMSKDPYSARLARDLRGLTDGAAALDIGGFTRRYPNGHQATLRHLSVWLVAQCRAGAADTRWIREVIYTDDGVRVLRWDRQRGQSSAPRSGEADSSHLWHTHLSGYRDCEAVDKAALFRRYVAEVAGAAPPVPPPAPPPGGRDWFKEMIGMLPVLKAGAKGPFVKRAQAILTANGHPTEIDGVFGTDTAARTRAMQAALGLELLDAIWGPETWTAALTGQDLV
ncbi:hypothetical protein Cs7R123_01130 [Catellatospora sp. TT07R-123]|uniref:peptidoglycan-binding domain-containing protein n=1 Tax=Catellatospora sp. TT07R-123 TaxID=2733863 RepID=UPI001B1AE7E8|nr:peptidoglycan-binding protein [Catellatospora sp. TT07R-123]GHJ42771.1 hypothetical protein Cs7R123_01130 [Catellatospora sp. TT07R-123]